jgi:hypothetical protein
MWEEAELDRRIEAKKKLLEELNEKAYKIQDSLQRAGNLYRELECTKGILLNMIDKCNSI